MEERVIFAEKRKIRAMKSNNMLRNVLLIVLAVMASGKALLAQNNNGTSKSVIVRQIKKVENMDSQWKNNSDSIAESSTNVGKMIQKSLKKTYDGNYKGLDTNYILLPDHPFIIKLSYNGQFFKHNVYAPSSVSGRSGRSSTNSDMANRIGIEASYRGAGIGFDFTVGGSKRNYLAFTYYHKRFGVELVSQRMNDVASLYRLNNSSPNGTSNEESMDISTFKLHGFFVINNHRKFSYPSVLTYSTIQKRTAGGFFATATYFHSSTEDKLPKTGQTESRKLRFKVKSDFIALGGGYGINVVPQQGKIVLHASVNPVVLVSFNKSSDTRVGPITREGSGTKGNTESKTSWSFRVQGRLAAVYNVSERFVVGVNACYDNFESTGSKIFRTSTTEATISANVGVRF